MRITPEIGVVFTPRQPRQPTRHRVRGSGQTAQTLKRKILRRLIFDESELCGVWVVTAGQDTIHSRGQIHSTGNIAIGMRKNPVSSGRSAESASLISEFPDVYTPQECNPACDVIQVDRFSSVQNQPLVNKTV